MNRRMALTLAGTAAVVLSAGTAAMAANLGILSAGAKEDPVGKLDAQNVSDLVTTTTAPAAPVVVYVDTYDTTPDAAPADEPDPAAATDSSEPTEAPAALAASPAPAPSSSASPSTKHESEHKEAETSGGERQDD